MPVNTSKHYRTIGHHPALPSSSAYVAQDGTVWYYGSPSSHGSNCGEYHQFLSDVRSGRRHRCTLIPALADDPTSPHFDGPRPSPAGA